jgi:hypothetical protein
MGRGGTRPYHTASQIFRHFLLPKPPPPHFHRMATGEGIHRDTGRQTPAAGAHIFSGQPNIFFVTVNAKDAIPWMANATVQQSLAEIWSKEATAWRVGLLPPHAGSSSFLLRTTRFAFRHRYLGRVLETPVQPATSGPAVVVAAEIVSSPAAQPD